MKKIIVALAFFSLSAALAVAAQPPIYKPFPIAQVTAPEWEKYREQVYAAHGASVRRFPDEHLEVLHSSDNVMHFAFTTLGHPAHPAWITRSAQNGSVDQIGYFAGQEEPFAKLFQSYLELTKRTIESAPDEPMETGPGSGAGTSRPGA